MAWRRNKSSWIKCELFHAASEVLDSSRLMISIATLLVARDVQMLALLSCIVLAYTQNAEIPPRPETSVAHSPEQDYFALPRFTPRHTPTQVTPVRKRSSITPVDTNQSSFRSSGWSQILNPSSLSIRTPGRPSVDTNFVSTPLATSFEEPSPIGFSIPVPGRRQSPRVRLEGRKRPSLTQIQSLSPPPQTPVPLTPGARSNGTDRSLGRSGGSSFAPGRSSGVQRSVGERTKSGYTEKSGTSAGDKHRLSFGGQSPLRRNYSRATGWSAETPASGQKKIKTCSVRVELPQDDSCVRIHLRSRLITRLTIQAITNATFPRSATAMRDLEARICRLPPPDGSPWSARRTLAIHLC